jgi:hypothetical protein
MVSTTRLYSEGDSAPGLCARGTVHGDQIFSLGDEIMPLCAKHRRDGLGHHARRLRHEGLKDRLGDQRGGSEWEPIKILLEGD